MNDCNCTHHHGTCIGRDIGRPEACLDAGGKPAALIEAADDLRKAGEKLASLLYMIESGEIDISLIPQRVQTTIQRWDIAHELVTRALAAAERAR